MSNVVAIEICQTSDSLQLNHNQRMTRSIIARFDDFVLAVYQYLLIRKDDCCLIQ